MVIARDSQDTDDSIVAYFFTLLVDELHFLRLES